jgi:hypothetical protein
VRGIGHIAAEHMDAPFLNGARAGDEGEQAGLADAVWSDQPDHAPALDVKRDGVKRARLAVRQPDHFEAHHGRGTARGISGLWPVHLTSLSVRNAGHSAFESIRT